PGGSSRVTCVETNQNFNFALQQNFLGFFLRELHSGAVLADFYRALGRTERDVHLITVGGRSEISGNHTDHNCGKVVAASVGLSVLAIVCPREDGMIRLKSHGFDEDCISINEIEAPSSKEFFRSASLIAGTVKGFEKRGLKVGGFDAYTASDVLKGSGLSSSAAFEVTVGKILSVLYNEDAVPSIELAKIAQFAENVYFGKPCGLMDQAACAVGGLITVDFENTKEPIVEKLDFSPTEMGYSLCIVDTGGCHADLNDEYASVPREMKAVAAALGGRDAVVDADGELGVDFLYILFGDVLFEQEESYRARLADT
ncbi:MAG: hypothetical protein IKU19_08715, partial [Clostridia bacterium]|nr:hypothetical protein [Clostridia bacterium]